MKDEELKAEEKESKTILSAFDDFNKACREFSRIFKEETEKSFRVIKTFLPQKERNKNEEINL